jgi:hypothetical protein
MSLTPTTPSLTSKVPNEDELTDGVKALMGMPYASQN